MNSDHLAPDPPPSKRKKGREKPYPMEAGTETAEMKCLIGRFIDQVVNNKNLSIIPEFFTDDCVLYGVNRFDDSEFGHKGVEKHINQIHSKFIGLKVYIEDIIVETDNIVLRWRGIYKQDKIDKYNGGFITSKICKVTRKIREQWHYWLPASILSS